MPRTPLPAPSYISLHPQHAFPSMCGFSIQSFISIHFSPMVEVALAMNWPLGSASELHYKLKHTYLKAPSLLQQQGVQLSGQPTG